MLEFFTKLWGFVSTPLFEISGNNISLLSLLLAIAVFLLTTGLANMVERLVNGFLETKHIDSGIKGSLSRFARYIVLTVGVLVTLDTVGISLSSLAALGAMLMVGIGFGLQNITQNFISGLIILLERPIKVGDLVEVKGISGKIVEIGARSTLIHTRDDVAIIVPNSQFISEQVVNESFSGDNVRLHLQVGVSYNSDPVHVKELLMGIARDHSKVLKHPVPEVFFDDFADSSLNFTLSIWVKDNWVQKKILSDMRFAIMESFKEAGIEIPFPQRDVHIIKGEVG